MNTFTLFPLLPLELRRKIWAHTFQPQILEYRLSTTHLPSFLPTQLGEPRSYNEFSCTKPPRVPIALHVCHESRSIALENYILSSGGTEPPKFLQDYPNLEPRPIYFNPNIDVVGFENLHESMDSPACWGPSRPAGRGSYGASPNFKDIKRLLLNATDWDSVGLRFIAGQKCSRGPQANFFTEFFPSLEEILIARSFNELRRHRTTWDGAGSSDTPGEVKLSRYQVFEMRYHMERDFRNVMAVRIPGWKPPKVRIVHSRHDIKEILNSETYESQKWLSILRTTPEYKEPPPPQYWVDFGVSASESTS